MQPCPVELGYGLAAALRDWKALYHLRQHLRHYERLWGSTLPASCTHAVTLLRVAVSAWQL